MESTTWTRALGVNVDQLFQFEDILSKDDMVKRINEIIESAREGSVENADSMLKELLHTY